MSQLKKSLLTLGAAVAVGGIVAADPIPATAGGHKAGENACKANPCGANPCKAKANPCGANPCKAKANPCGANPCKAKANPCGANPCKAKANPCGANPCKAKANPCGANPCKAKANPCGANPCKAKANPCGANPCKAKANPCGANPCKAKANPCGANPCRANPCGANPCKAAANPCGANPCRANPCGANPCSANPCGANPCGAAKAVALTGDQAAKIYAAMAKKLRIGYQKSGLNASKYKNWKRYNTVPYKSETHGGRYVNNFANQKARSYSKYDGELVLPVGSVLVKDSFAPTSTDKASPGPLFVMEKMAKGWNSASLDWKYTLLMPDGTVFGVTKGNGGAKVQFCVDCHKAAGASQLFFLPEAMRVKN